MTPRFQFVGFLLATILIAPINRVFCFPANLDIIQPTNLDIIQPTTTVSTKLPIPEDILHELRTLMNVTNDYYITKRSAQVLYGCRSYEVLARAVCDQNTIVTWCKLPNTPQPGQPRREWQRSRDECIEGYCSDNALGSNPPKAACMRGDTMGYGHMGSGGGHGCAGINAAWAQDQQVRVGVLVYSDVGKRKGYEPDQITLTNGNKHMVQAVGPADIKGGHFISKYFKYIGGIDGCVYGKVSFDTPALTWYSYVTSW